MGCVSKFYKDGKVVKMWFTGSVSHRDDSYFIESETGYKKGFKTKRDAVTFLLSKGYYEERIKQSRARKD